MNCEYKLNGAIFKLFQLTLISTAHIDNVEVFRRFAPIAAPLSKKTKVRLKYLNEENVTLNLV